MSPPSKINARLCQGCGTKAKRVDVVTVRTLVKTRAQHRLAEADGYRFCAAPDCDTVYSHPSTGLLLRTSDVTVDVCQKSKRPERPVCYCFGYSVADVERDARADEPRVVADIEDKCRQGLDRCELENPQGCCCLGNVRAVAKDAMRTADNVRGADAPARKAGTWAASGAVVAAVLSSACCWLPLLLVAVGVSAGSAGVLFESYRWLFLGVTAVLLAAGFYFVYFRQPLARLGAGAAPTACKPGDACAAPNRKLQRFNKIMLWVATVFVASFAFFPNYVGFLLGGADELPVAVAEEPTSPNPSVPKPVTRDYAVVGMSCEGCTVHVKDALAAVPGVTVVQVNYRDNLVRVTFAAGTKPDDSAVLAAMDELGYEASLDRGQP